MFNKRVYPDQIANYLINNTEAATETDRDALTDIIYALLADAENDRNPEACRTLYKALEELTSAVYEITCIYYYKGLKHTAIYKGQSFADAYNRYLEDSDHDTRIITSVDSYTTI